MKFILKREKKCTFRYPMKYRFNIYLKYFKSICLMLNFKWKRNFNVRFIKMLCDIKFMSK